MHCKEGDNRESFRDEEKFARALFLLSGGTAARYNAHSLHSCNISKDRWEETQQHRQWVDTT